MIDLQQASGLPIKLDEKKNILILGEGIRQVIPDVRTAKQMKCVLMQPSAKTPDNFYFMYRGVCLREHEEMIRGHNLRYDITVIPAFNVGGEHAKTFGNFHPKKLGTDTTYPEVCEILHGRAHFCLQKSEGKKVEDFIMVPAGEGDKVVMLPEYRHVSINPGSETLVMSNWVSGVFSSVYKDIERLHGISYYETVDGFVKNKHYLQMPKIRRLKPKEVPEFGITREPLYKTGIENIEKLSFLNNPEMFKDTFERLKK